MCGRWLHEDCAEDHRVDQSGQDRFCYSCLDLPGLIFTLWFPKVEYIFVCASPLWPYDNIYDTKFTLLCRVSKAARNNVCSTNAERKAFIGERKLTGRLIIGMRGR